MTPRSRLPHLTRAAKVDPNQADIQALLGQARTLTGDREGALRAYRKAAELLPGDQSVGGCARTGNT